MLYNQIQEGRGLLNFYLFYVRGEYMISIEKMPTAVTADKHPIHNWFNFVAGYAPEYVEKVIDDLRKRTDTRLEQYMTHLLDVEQREL